MAQPGGDNIFRKFLLKVIPAKAIFEGKKVGKQRGAVLGKMNASYMGLRKGSAGPDYRSMQAISSTVSQV